MNTVILTDCPEQLGEFFPQAPTWRQAGARSLSAPLRNLWHAIGTGGSAWTADAPDSRQYGDWDALAIIDQAPESQFDALRRAAARNEDLPAASACLALRGRGFHGHRDRAWAVEKGNLHLTTLHSCTAPVSRVGLGFSMLPTVAAARVLEEQAAPGQIGIKWVNDILIDGHKVAGALTSTQIEQDAYTSVIMGLGINVEQTPTIETSSFVPAAGCLADLLPTNHLALPDVVPRILRAFDDAYRKLVSEGCADLLEAYRNFSCCLGKEVAIWAEDISDFASNEPLARGRLLRILDDLSLELEGGQSPISKGRLAFMDQALPMGASRIAD